MKYKTHFTIFLSCAVLSLFLTSCAMEKRHYRKGYYVQHTNANNSKHEQQIGSDKEREESRANDVTAKTTSADSTSLDVQCTSIESKNAQTSFTALSAHSTLQKCIGKENQTHSDTGIYYRDCKTVPLPLTPNKVTGNQSKEKPWLKITLISFLLALVFFGLALGVTFEAAAWMVLGMLALLTAFIFSLVSNAYYKKHKQQGTFSWRRAVAALITVVSVFGILIAGWIALWMGAGS